MDMVMRLPFAVKRKVQVVSVHSKTIFHGLQSSKAVLVTNRYLNAEYGNVSLKIWLLALLIGLTVFIATGILLGVFTEVTLLSLRAPNVKGRVVRPFEELLRKIPRKAMTLYEGVVVSEPAKRLPKTGRLLCFVITTPKYSLDRVPAVNETWLPRCDHGEFFSTSDMSPDVPYSTPFTNVPDAYSYLFRKTIVAFHYAFTKISDKFDWYFKADDDTYVIMEHMYEYLEKFNPNEPYYFGYRMKPHLVRGYNGGGGGYVLSRAAVKLFLDRAFYNRKICPFDNNEDVGMGRCLQNLEIFPYDTRNEKGQHRFHTYRPDVQFNGAIANEWHFYPQKTGHEWIADDLITFHHMKPDEMRIFDDLLYRMRSPQLSKFSRREHLKNRVERPHLGYASSQPKVEIFDPLPTPPSLVMRNSSTRNSTVSV